MSSPRPPLLTPLLRWFLFAMILANISGAMIYPLLPVYLSELGATVGQVGLVFSLASLVPLLLQIFGGWLSDTIGRLRAIAIGASAATFGYFVMVLAPSWQWVLAGLSLEYISGALVGPSFGAFVAEQSSEKTRGRVFGLTNSLFTVVQVVGPPLGGLLAFRWGFRLMLLVGAVLYAVATTLRLWMARQARFAGPRAPQRPTLATFRSNLAALAGLIGAGGIVTWILITDGVRDIA